MSSAKNAHQTEIAIRGYIRDILNQLPKLRGLNMEFIVCVILSFYCKAISNMRIIKLMQLQMQLIGDNILYIGNGYNKKYITKLSHYLNKKNLHIINADFGCNFTIYQDNSANYYFNNYDGNHSWSYTFKHDSINQFNCLQYFAQTDSPIIRKLCCNSSGGCAFWITENNGQILGNGSNDHLQLGWPPKHAWSLALKKQFEPKPILENFKCVTDVQSSRYYSIALTLPTLTIERVTIWIKHIDIGFVEDIIPVIFRFYGTHKDGVYSIGGGGDGGNGHRNRTIVKWEEIITLKDVCIVKISVGMGHSLFLQANGSLWSCGRNDEGQLGLGIHNLKYTAEMRPMEIKYFKENGIYITDMICGWYHNLAIDDNGNVYSWGYNKYGQCGDNSSNDIIKPKLIKYLKGYEVNYVECGKYHSYVRTSDGKHFLFGRNNANQCITNDDRDIVTVPFCINYVLGDAMNKRIESIKVGVDETLIFFDSCKLSTRLN